MATSVTVRRKPKDLCEIVANNMLIYRTKLGMTQVELADSCDFHRTYIGSVERGERNVTLATIEAFAHAFGIAPALLLVVPR